MIKRLLSYLLNEDGKGGGIQTTTTEQAPLTEAERELNKQQIARTLMQGERMKTLSPEGKELLEQQLAGGRETLKTQAAGEQAFRQYLGGGDLTAAREQLRSEIIQDTLDKLKGDKPWVSAQEKAKTRQLETGYTEGTARGLGTLSEAIGRRMQGMAKAEGLRPGDHAQRFMGQRLTRELETSQRAGGMLGAQTRLGLTSENRMNLARQLESREQLGRQARWGRVGLLSGRSGLGGGVGVGGGVGGFSPIAMGSQSLSGTLAKLQQARSEAATQTESMAKSRGGAAQTIGGAAAGMKVGSTIGTAVMPGIGTAVGAIIGTIGGAIFGYNS